MSNKTWQNNDGLHVRFGQTAGKRDTRVGTTLGNSKEQEAVFRVVLTGAARTIYPADLDNDGTTDGFTGLDGKIPAGAKILSQNVLEIVTPAGGTNYAVGTYQEDGTVVDADGIRVTAGTDGALVGTVLANAANVAAVTTGTYTAGEIEVIIRYLVA